MSGPALAIQSTYQPDSARHLHVHLFGPMEVRIGGEPLPRLRSRKGLWLLAILALRAGKEVERGWLAGTLWPEDDEAAARVSLRKSLHDLRRALGRESSRLSTDSVRTLRLEPDGVFVDALVFDAEVASGDIDSLEAAVRLYRGPLLEDCTEEWAIEERRRREQAYVGALEILADDAVARRQPEAAASYLRSAVAADPYREDLHRALMRALVTSGNPAGAVTAYRELRTLLWRELSVAPAEATTELFRSIRQKAARIGTPASESRRGTEPPPAGPVARASQRPVPLTELIGREEAIKEILFLLTRARLVTLMGTGGVGKTRLALKVAEEAEEEFDDGACFVDLSALSDPGLVPEAVCEALAVPRGDGRLDGIGALKQYLARRRLLLVLDNCEHLLAACAMLANTVLSGASGLRILATSRHALGLRGETIWRVPSLALPLEQGAGPPGAALDAAASPATYPAVQLFVERARASEPSFEMTLENAPSVVEICRRLDGIPLAIELAAARVRSLTVAEISDRLRTGFGILTSGGPAVLPRQQTLDAAFRWSWDLLTEQERTALRRLSVFAGGWSLAAAQAVCAGEDAPAESMLDVLTTLIDKSLVVYASPGAAGTAVLRGKSSGRYHLLETVRQFAAERLQESGEQESTLDRHRDYFLAMAENAVGPHYGPDEVRWFRCAEVEHDNLRAAIEWCRRAGQPEEEFRLVSALSRFWGTRGHLREGQARLEEALSRLPSAYALGQRAGAIIAAGWMALVRGDYEKSIRHFSSALEIYRELRDVPDEAATLNYLASATASAGDLAAARTLFEESLRLHRALGSPRGLASVLNNLGETLLRSGDSEEARGYIEESIFYCRQVGGAWQLYGIALGNLSASEFRLGRSGEARERCSEALGVLQECGADIDIPATLDQMAIVEGSLGASARSACLLGAAEGLRQAFGARPDDVMAAERGAAYEACQRALGRAGFDAAFARGQTMDLTEAVAFALQDEDLTADGAAGPPSEGLEKPAM